mmetsp:Transcript_13947/g.25740  ORF Transcript_13947/g.25740 Transcript_13947/m.25740 type:complete len:281 (-) Transcript_13947:40-882(-)
MTSCCSHHPCCQAGKGANIVHNHGGLCSDITQGLFLKCGGTYFPTGPACRRAAARQRRSASSARRAASAAASARARASASARSWARLRRCAWTHVCISTQQRPPRDQLSCIRLLTDATFNLSSIGSAMAIECKMAAIKHHQLKGSAAKAAASVVTSEQASGSAGAHDGSPEASHSCSACVEADEDFSQTNVQTSMASTASLMRTRLGRDAAFTSGFFSTRGVACFHLWAGMSSQMGAAKRRIAASASSTASTTSLWVLRKFATNDILGRLQRTACRRRWV